MMMKTTVFACLLGHFVVQSQVCTDYSPSDASLAAGTGEDDCITQGLVAELACCCVDDACASCGDCELSEYPSTTAECDTTDETNWRMVPVGKSTQFKLYEECNDNFVKVKMSGLTEYDSSGKKTNTKVTSFASSDGWSFGSGEGISRGDCDGNGNDCIFNRFQVDELKGVEASFLLDTVLAVDPLNVTVEGANGTQETLLVAEGSVKFSVEIGNWPFEDEESTLQLCINIQTSQSGTLDETDNGREFRLSTMELDNVMTAQCDNDTISVDVELDSNGNNKLDVCYWFEYCDGIIFYDPILTVSSSNAETSKAKSIGVEIAAIFVLALICVYV